MVDQLALRAAISVPEPGGYLGYRVAVHNWAAVVHEVVREVVRAVVRAVAHGVDQPAYGHCQSMLRCCYKLGHWHRHWHCICLALHSLGHSSSRVLEMGHRHIANLRTATFVARFFGVKLIALVMVAHLQLSAAWS